MVTSALPGEGKTTTATNLAVTLAEGGQKVLLIDADLRRGDTAALLGLEGSVGLTSVLIGSSELEESTQQHQQSGLHFLAGGPRPPNPTEVLQSPAAGELFRRLSKAYDVVIIDTPPLLPVADASVLARESDGAILVVAHGQTSRQQLRHATDQLHGVGAHIVGTVINMAPRRGRRARGYAGYYAYESRD